MAAPRRHELFANIFPLLTEYFKFHASTSNCQSFERFNNLCTSCVMISGSTDKYVKFSHRQNVVVQLICISNSRAAEQICSKE